MEPEEQQPKSDQPASTQQDEPLPSIKANAQPETSPSPTESSSHLKNKLFLPLILAVVLLLTILAIAGIFIFKNFNSKQTKVSSTKNQQVLTITPVKEPPSPTPDPTANWKTYTNTEYGFSVRYPTNAKTVSRSPDPFPIAIQIDNLQPRTGEGGGPEVEGWFMAISTPQNNPDKLSLSEWGAKKLTKVMDYGTGIISSIIPTETTIGKHDAVTWQDLNGIVQYYLIEKTPTKVIFIWINKDENPVNNAQLFDQILSTFRFLDEETTNIISGSIYAYRAEIKNDQLMGTFQLTAQSTQGKIKEIRIWTDTKTETQWQPFQEFVEVPFGNTEFIYVEFKDDKGNISPIYSDTIHPQGGPPIAPE